MDRECLLFLEREILPRLTSMEKAFGAGTSERTTASRDHVIYGSSPLLYEGKLYSKCCNEIPGPMTMVTLSGCSRARVLHPCIDPATGKDLWRQVRKTDSTKESQEAYTTPFPYQGKTRSELVIVGGDHVSGHDLGTGQEFWRARLYDKRDDWYRIVTSPVGGDGLIYASGPKGQPLVAFKEGGKGDVTDTGVAWSSKQGHTDWSTPLLYKGRLFVMDGAKKTLTRFDPQTGAPDWTGSLGVTETVWSSPTGADGRSI